jgi:hypothetical protein
VSDLPAALSDAAVRALDASRSAYTRYLDLLDAQRAALRSGDLHLLATLADEATAVLGTLEREARVPPELDQQLPAASGPRASAVRTLMADLRLEVETARAGIGEFTSHLEPRRRALLGALAELSGGGSPYRHPRPDPAAVDRTG